MGSEVRMRRQQKAELKRGRYTLAAVAGLAPGLDGFFTGVAATPPSLGPFWQAGAGVLAGTAKTVKFLAVDMRKAWVTVQANNPGLPDLNSHDPTPFYGHTRAILAGLREVYGPMLGGLHVRAGYMLVMHVASGNAGLGLHIGLSPIYLCVFSMGALFTDHYEINAAVVEENRGVETAEDRLDTQPCCSRVSNPVAKHLSKFMHGESLARFLIWLEESCPGLGKMPLLEVIGFLTQSAGLGSLYGLGLSEVLVKRVILFYMPVSPETLDMVSNVALAAGGVAGTAMTYSKRSTLNSVRMELMRKADRIGGDLSEEEAINGTVSFIVSSDSEDSAQNGSVGGVIARATAAGLEGFILSLSMPMLASWIMEAWKGLNPFETSPEELSEDDIPYQTRLLVAGFMLIIMTIIEAKFLWDFLGGGRAQPSIAGAGTVTTFSPADTQATTPPGGPGLPKSKNGEGPGPA